MCLLTSINSRTSPEGTFCPLPAGLPSPAPPQPTREPPEPIYCPLKLPKELPLRVVVEGHIRIRRHRLRVR